MYLYIYIYTYFYPSYIYDIYDMCAYKFMYEIPASHEPLRCGTSPARFKYRSQALRSSAVPFIDVDDRSDFQKQFLKMFACMFFVAAHWIFVGIKMNHSNDIFYLVKKNNRF